MVELKDTIAETISNFLTQNDLWLVVTIAFVIVTGLMALGGLLTWLWKGKKIQLEIKNSEDQLATNKLKRLEKAYEYDDEVELNAQLLAQSLKDVIQEIKNNDVDKVIEKREEALNHFFYDYLKSFNRYLDVKSLSITKDYRTTFVKNEIFPVLDNMINFLETINIPELTTKIGKTEARLKKASIDTIQSTANRNLRFWNIKLNSEIKSKIEKLYTHSY